VRSVVTGPVKVCSFSRAHRERQQWLGARPGGRGTKCGRAAQEAGGGPPSPLPGRHSRPSRKAHHSVLAEDEDVVVVGVLELEVLHGHGRKSGHEPSFGE
jgi:hypothetical protein